MKLWTVKIMLGLDKLVVVNVRGAKGHEIGIAVKRVLDASCPHVGICNVVTIEVEREN